MRLGKKKKAKWEDHYSRKAKKERYPARSIYKLQEMQDKYNIIKKGDNVLDLGCSPGSWLIYTANMTGKNGHVVGIDLKPVTIKVPSHAKVYTKNVLDVEDDFWESLNMAFNSVISDMAPLTTGNKFVDAARSVNLCEAALSIARKRLVKNGVFLCKIFQGEDFKRFSDSVKKVFNKHYIFKPHSSRNSSKEIYVIGLGKK